MVSKKQKKERVPLSKSTAAYWQRKVFREKKFKPTEDAGTGSRGSVKRELGWQSANYYVRMQVGETRRKMRLEATVAEDAGREALGLYRRILRDGWPEKQGGRTSGQEPADHHEVRPGNAGTTVGQWIESALANATVRPETARKYAESLRTIVGDILSLSRARKPESRRRIDGFPVDSLHTDALTDWVAKRTRAAGADVVKVRRACNTIRTLVANAKALFTPVLQDAMGIPEEQHRLPFAKVRLPKKSTLLYTSRFDARLLLQQGAEELGAAAADEDGSQFEQWKILYLALVAGLRYREIDNLRKEDVSPTRRRISIRAHGSYQPKTSSSEADVSVSEEAASVLEGMLARGKGKWFVSEARSKRSAAYRTAAHHERLVSWLRNYEEQGVRPLAGVHKPLHELRKEAGTLVNAQHGLNEAKNFLRHTSIHTTASFYLGSKGEVTTGLGRQPFALTGGWPKSWRKKSGDPI